jgi:membrane-associated PAP2 superfamily phosphatase
MKTLAIVAIILGVVGTIANILAHNWVATVWSTAYIVFTLSLSKNLN